jgi:hypothetical protein
VSKKLPERWSPTLTVCRQGWKIVFTAPGAESVEFIVGPRELTRFYYQLRQALSGNSAKNLRNVDH